MPPVIAAVAAWAAAYAGVIAVVTVVVTAGTAIYGAAQARKAERQARDAARDAMKDRMVTRIATEAPHRYIYGRAKVGADIVAMFTSGDKDQFRHLVCVHAAHECDAIEEIWVNNVLVDPIDYNGNAAGGRFAVAPNMYAIEEKHTGPTFTLGYSPRDQVVWVFGGEGTNMHRLPVRSVNGKTVTIDFAGPVVVNYERAVFNNIAGPIAMDNEPVKNPVVNIQRHLGGQDDVADMYLRSMVGDKWPATAVLRGLCYTVITLDLNHSEFQSGLVPIHAVIRGRKLYDPRDGQTRWSANPALAIMDYLTSPLCDVPMSDLPLAQFITAANVCDEAAPDIGARYTINGTVTSDQDQKGVLESMAQCMAGGLVATTWDVYAGKYIAPVAALTQADIVGSLSINPGVSDASVYNGVKGQYIGPENKHVQTDFTPYQNAAYREADGRDLYTNIDFPFTDSLQRVTNLARIFTEDQRNGFTIKAEFSLKAWPLKVGQRITYTSPFIGQTNKVYRITDKSYAPNSAVQLTLKEDAASIWDFADAVVLDSTPNTDLPDPWRIDQLDSIDCTSGESTLLRQADGSTVPRILVTWPATVQQNGVQVEIEWRAVSSATWERTTVSADGTQAYLSPITPGFFYVVRARCVNPYMNTSSGWVTTVYQVEVFTALPTVYKWAATKPAAPTGTATYTWASGSFGAAPASWSTTIPAAPAGGGASLWAAMVPVSDVTDVTTVFDWALAEVTLRDQNVAAGLIAAQAAADAAITAVADMARDDLLSPAEKPAESLRWVTIVSERPGIDAQAAALGITTERTAYANAYNALNTYITSLGSQFATIPGTAISIVGATYRANFKAYYDAKQALLNAMAAKAATQATYGGVTGKPDVWRIITAGGACTLNPPVQWGIHLNGVFQRGVRRSYTFIAIRRSDHVVTHSQNYDVFGVGADSEGRAAAHLAADLNWYLVNGKGQFIIIVYSFDEPYNFRLSSGLDTLMYAHGASRAVFGSPQFQYRAAYALIGISGCGEGNGVEAYQGVVPDDPNSWIDVTMQLYQGQILGVTSNYKPKTLRDYSYTGDLNATAGAPAGTTVGSTPATTVEQTVNDINSPFSISLSGTLASSVAAGGPRTYGTLSATLVGGTGTVTLLWEAQVQWTNSSTGASVQLSLTGNDLTRGVVGTAPNGASISYTVKVTANDSKGRSRTATREYSTSHGTIQ